APEALLPFDVAADWKVRAPARWECPDAPFFSSFRHSGFYCDGHSVNFGTLRRHQLRAGRNPAFAAATRGAATWFLGTTWYFGDCPGSGHSRPVWCRRLVHGPGSTEGSSAPGSP